MSKFKVGDRVVILNKDTLLAHQRVSIGKVLTVDYVDSNNKALVTSNGDLPYLFSEAEHEDIYFSPLYQALL